MPAWAAAAWVQVLPVAPWSRQNSPCRPWAREWGASSDASGRTMMECMGRVFHAWVRGVCPAAAAVAGVVLWGMLECRWHPPWPSAASPLPAPALLVRMSRRSLCRLDEMMGWWGLCLHSQQWSWQHRSWPGSAIMFLDDECVSLVFLQELD